MPKAPTYDHAAMDALVLEIVQGDPNLSAAEITANALRTPPRPGVDPSEGRVYTALQELLRAGKVKQAPKPPMPGQRAGVKCWSAK